MVSFASLTLGESGVIVASPRVVARILERAHGELSLTRELLATLTPAQREGRVRLPSPLPIGSHWAPATPLDLTSADRRVLTHAALSVTDDADVLLNAAAVDIGAIVTGAAAQYLRFERGRFAFVDPGARDAIAADTTSGERRQAHQNLSRVQRNQARFRNAWHAANASPSSDSRLCETLLRFALQLAAAGNSLAAFEVASATARLSSGELRDRARLAAASAALWAGHPEDAAAELDHVSRTAASRRPAVELKEALDSLRQGAVGGGDVRQSAIDALDPFTAATMSTTDRDLLTAMRAVISISLEGDLRESDAAAARLRLSTAPTPATWPWTTQRPAPSPLAESHIVALTSAFELRARQFESAWDTLMQHAQRLPVELPAKGIIASLIRLIGAQIGRESWVAEAIEALAPSPPLRYDPGIPAISELSGAVSKNERSLVGAIPVEFDPDRLLSRRERQVAELAMRGLSNRAVAERLDISPRTVEVHLAKVYRKLGVPSRSMLISRRTGAESENPTNVPGQ